MSGSRSLLSVAIASVAACLLIALYAAGPGAGWGEAQAGRMVIDPALRSAISEAGASTKMRAILTYDRRPTAAQTEAVRSTGVAVETFRVLPMLAVEGTGSQVQNLLTVAGPVSIFADRELEYMLHESRQTIGADRATRQFGLDGEGVGVAVIDSGVDGTNEDVAYPERTVQNVKIAGDAFFTGQTVVAEDLSNTDTSSGHGTHVAGTVGGSGANSDGYYTGVAPGSDLVGIGAGDTLFILYALEAFDWALANREEYDIRVISNSWGTSGKFRERDPINVASRKANAQGVTVVFAAGNEGPGKDTLNPYSVAPWVIGVAAGKKNGETLADFSSRGVPGSKLYHPTITAPGVNIVSSRASTGATINALDAADDATYIPPQWQPFYTTASGTSMATPHVSGTIALMEEANGALGPDRIKSILRETAAPMPRYDEYEAGAGYLDAYDAVSRARALR